MKMTKKALTTLTQNLFPDRHQKKKFKFRESHPGGHFCHLAKLKNWFIPKNYLYKERLSNIEDWKIDGTQVGNDIYKIREDYAKISLLVFYPHPQLDDLVSDGSYWRLFYKDLKRHGTWKWTALWKQGFGILQNIQDCMTMDKIVSMAVEILDFI